MGFDLSNLFSYHTNNDAYSSKTAASGTNSVSPSGEKEGYLTLKDLSAFPKGSSITGQVISVEGDTVQLKLGDDTYVNAKLERELNVAVGQKLTFEVKSNSGNTLSLTPLFTNLNTSTNVIKGLEAANLPVNEASVNMVTAMMDKGMSIDVSSLQTMYRQVLANPQALPSNLVEMKELSIPITKENIMQFETYQNYEHQILSGMEEIVNNMEQTCLELIRAGDGQAAAAIYKEVTAMLAEGAMDFAAEGGLAETDGGIENTAVFMEAKGQIASELTGALPEKLILPEETALLSGEERTKQMPEGKNPADSGEQIADGRAKALTAIFTDELMQLSGEKKLAYANNVEDKGVSGEADAGKNQFAMLLGTKERAALAGHMTQLGVPEKIAAAIKDGTISMKQLFSLLHQVSEGGEHGELLQRLYSSKEFQTLIRDQMTKQFLLEPETVGKEGKVTEFYNRLNERTARLMDALGSMGIGKEDSPLFKSINGLRQNVDFMNQLNQTFAYVQLPLKFSQGSGHGDLYVYTNKKNLAKEKGTISALLHLDMKHLGPVDVYVAMTGGENVNTRFYLKDDDMLDFVESNIHILNERLEKRGYHVKVEFAVKDQEKKSFGELLAKEQGGEKNVLLSTQAFDVRA